MGRVERATRKELRDLRISLESSATAALAVSLAGQIDAARGAVAAAAAAGQLRILMVDLRAQAAALRQERDGIDDLAARRADRRGTASG
jgi:hypothetical protein